MSRIEEVIARYDATEALLRGGAPIFAVGDPAGASLNAAVRRIICIAGEDGPDLWGELLAAAKALRWRRMTQLQPVEQNPAAKEAAAVVLRESQRLRTAVSSQSVLQNLVAATESVLTGSSPVGAELLTSINEVGCSESVVVAASKPAQIGLASWLAPKGVRVITVGDLASVGKIDQLYVVGPPSFFPSSLVTAPVTDQLTFVLPAWFVDRSIPTSRLAEWAERPVRVKGRLFQVGDTTEPAAPDEIGLVEDEYVPQPTWGRRISDHREPTREEVGAHKVLLGDGLAIWLDDGDRIRTLDPRQPAGERVASTAVDAVRPGTYLVLRHGSTERGAMYEAALGSVGSQAPTIAATQERWKRALADRIAAQGHARTIRDLRAMGVRSAERAPAWPEPTLICPKRDHDLELLLEWLKIPVNPTYANAVALRRALYRASAELREELESAVDRADLSALERDGLLSLDIQKAGFRGIVAVRVLAISPHTEIVLRREARVPFKSGGSAWLE